MSALFRLNVTAKLHELSVRRLRFGRGSDPPFQEGGGVVGPVGSGFCC